MLPCPYERSAASVSLFMVRYPTVPVRSVGSSAPHQKQTRFEPPHEDLVIPTLISGAPARAGRRAMWPTTRRGCGRTSSASLSSPPGSSTCFTAFPRSCAAFRRVFGSSARLHARTDIGQTSILNNSITCILLSLQYYHLLLRYTRSTTAHGCYHLYASARRL